MSSLHQRCAEIESSLPLWVGGDLEPAAVAEVERHLAACRPCSDLAARARSARAALLDGLAKEPAGPACHWPVIREVLLS